MKTVYAASFVVALLAVRTAAFAQTEFHLQYGTHLNPFSASRHGTIVFTVQQASRWKLGDSFFFLDYLDDGGRDGFNDRDFYAEWYPTLSFGKLAKRALRVGAIRDFALIAGGQRGRRRQGGKIPARGEGVVAHSEVLVSEYGPDGLCRR